MSFAWRNYFHNAYASQEKEKDTGKGRREKYRSLIAWLDDVNIICNKVIRTILTRENTLQVLLHKLVVKHNKICMGKVLKVSLGPCASLSMLLILYLANCSQSFYYFKVQRGWEIFTLILLSGKVTLPGSWLWSSLQQLKETCLDTLTYAGTTQGNLLIGNDRAKVF